MNLPSDIPGLRVLVERPSVVAEKTSYMDGAGWCDAHLHVIDRSPIIDAHGLEYIDKQLPIYFLDLGQSVLPFS